MKKILFVFILLLTLCACQEPTMQTIVNNSGIEWQNTQVWMCEKPLGKYAGLEKVGTVKDGDTIRVESSTPYFYIYAFDPQGKAIKSDIKPFDKGVTCIMPDEIVYPE